MRVQTHGVWGMAIAAALVLAACGGGDDSAEAGGDSSARSPSSSGEEPADCEPGGEPIAVGSLDPGKHSTDQIGTGVTFTIDERWLVPISEPDTLILQSVDPPKPFTRAVQVMRNVSLQGTAEPGVDLDAFLRSNSDVTATNRRQVTVAGSDAIVADVTSTTRERTFLLASVGPMVLRPSEVARTWVVDQGGEPPIVLFSPVAKKDADWLDTTADDVVDSIKLGPLAGTEGGEARDCQAAAGVDGGPGSTYTTTQFTLGQFSVDQFLGAVGEEPLPGFVLFELVRETVGAAPTVAFFAPTQTADGTPLPDKQAFLEEVEARGGTVEEVGEIEFLGEPVTGYESQGLVLGRLSLAQDGGDPDEALISPSPVGKDYLVDTEEGLLVVAASADNKDDLANAEALLDLMAETFTWVE